MDLLYVEPPRAVHFDASIDAWVLSRYTDVRAALQDTRLAAGVDGDWHQRYRDAAASAFSGPVLVTWRSAVQREAELICEHLRSIERFDLVSDFARPISTAAAALVTGESSREARQDARAVFDAAAEPFNVSRQEQGREATGRLAARFGGELAPLYVQAFVALSESVPAFLGNSCYALFSHTRLAGATTGLEELLRYAGPSKAQLRTASAPTEIDGQSIATHDRVVLMLASANRDPSVFPEPERLALMRSPNQHLAFGAGPHSCVGAALVRMVASVSLEVLTKAFPAMSVQAARVRNKFALRAIDSLQASPSTSLRPDRH